MSDQTTPAEVPAAAPETGKTRRDTVVLSEVPDAAALSSPPAGLAEPDPHRGSDARSDRGPDQAPVLRSNHSSSALAVLSQRYHILAEVGRGDLCFVYKAQDKETGNTVALKLLRPDVSFDPATLERFKNDVLLAGEITHPNICRVYDVHLPNATACVSMHFVEGESLRSLLERTGSLPLRRGIDLTLQVCAGLAEAHGFGIVHGDLKPENVMIDPHGTAKITDFLFAPLLAAAKRITGMPAVALPYTAPERAEGKPLDRRADIYSLGVLLHEIFTGKVPVVTEASGRRPSKQAPDRRTLARDIDIDAAIPVSLERIILRCLEEDPAKRYQTVAELESDLSSSGIRTILPSGSGVETRTTLSNREAIAHPDAVPLTAPRPRPRGFSIRFMPTVGILLGAISILAMLGALHVTGILRLARRVAPPLALHAPHPPVFALEKSASKDSRSQSAESQIPAFDEIPTAPANSRVPDTSPDSSNSLETVSPGPAKSVTREPVSSDAASTNYLWIGRFNLQASAQEMANKIEGLGFPAVIVPRRNPTGDFFVVLSGPFSPSKASATLGELQMDGFADIHLIKNLMLDQ